MKPQFVSKLAPLAISALALVLASQAEAALKINVTVLGSGVYAVVQDQVTGTGNRPTDSPTTPSVDDSNATGGAVSFQNSNLGSPPAPLFPGFSLESRASATSNPPSANGFVISNVIALTTGTITPGTVVQLNVTSAAPIANGFGGFTGTGPFNMTQTASISVVQGGSAADNLTFRSCTGGANTEFNTSGSCVSGSGNLGQGSRNTVPDLPVTAFTSTAGYGLTQSYTFTVEPNSSYSFQGQTIVSTTPEPATLALMSLPLMGAGWWTRRKNRQS